MATEQPKRCDGCQYYTPLTAATGSCHRYPPVAVSSLWSLPVCRADNWCGEWVKAK